VPSAGVVILTNIGQTDAAERMAETVLEAVVAGVRGGALRGLWVAAHETWRPMRYPIHHCLLDFWMTHGLTAGVAGFCLQSGESRTNEPLP
jgi:hypothetical protein